MAKPFKNQKNKEKYRTIFNLFYDRVYRTAYYFTKDRHLAQDVLQETFVKAFRNLDHVEDEEKIGAWLTTIASRTAIDEIRKQKRWNGIPTENIIMENQYFMEEVAPSLESQVEEREIKEQIRFHIQRLSEHDQLILFLKYINECKDEEIAELLDIKVGTVKSRLHRAKNKLKVLLTESGTVMDGDRI